MTFYPQKTSMQAIVVI